MPVVNAKDIQGLKTVPSYRFEKLPGLVLRERRHFVMFPARSVDHFSHIPLHQAEPQRILERAMQHPMYVMDRRG
jgi:hypothetical protein